MPRSALPRLYSTQLVRRGSKGGVTLADGEFCSTQESDRAPPDSDLPLECWSTLDGTFGHLEQVGESELYGLCNVSGTTRYTHSLVFFRTMTLDRSIESRRLLAWLSSENQQSLISIYYCTALCHYVVSRFDPDSKKGATSMHQGYQTAIFTFAMILSSVRYVVLTPPITTMEAQR